MSGKSEWKALRCTACIQVQLAASLLQCCEVKLAGSLQPSTCL